MQPSMTRVSKVNSKLPTSSMPMTQHQGRSYVIAVADLVTCDACAPPITIANAHSNTRSACTASSRARATTAVHRATETLRAGQTVRRSAILASKRKRQGRRPLRGPRRPSRVLGRGGRRRRTRTRRSFGRGARIGTRGADRAAAQNRRR